MKLFSTGLEQANVVMTSNILEFLWNKISERGNAHQQSSSSLGYDLYYDDQKKIYFVTFVTWSTEKELLEVADLVSSTSSVANESFALLDFLQKKGDFAINKAAITLFDQNRQQLSQLKDEVNSFLPDEEDDFFGARDVDFRELGR